MAVKITIKGPGRLTIRIAGSRAAIDTAPSDVGLLVDENRDRLSVYTRAPRRRDGRRSGSRRDVEGSVTSAMEAAAITAFLAGADTARLGRTLADVYRAMDAVRRRDASDDDAF